jgi:hypothetical protein
MANLQRLPGSTAHMKLLPGQREGKAIFARSPAAWRKMAAWRLA